FHSTARWSRADGHRPPFSADHNLLIEPFNSSRDEFIPLRRVRDRGGTREGLGGLQRVFRGIVRRKLNSSRDELVPLGQVWKRTGTLHELLRLSLESSRDEFPLELGLSRDECRYVSLRACPVHELPAVHPIGRMLV